MAKINLLPEHVANQIAAGEVVEGPASIIKELVENSIDAASTKIYVEVSKNFSKVQVNDNGSGIAPEDLALAFKRHATSKIQSLEDVYRIMTNGFRGEALASIAAISKLTCISKREEDKHASKIYIENDIESLSETGAATGTTIIVDDIFFNTPARLKFLKANKRERTVIIDLLRSFAIANPGIAFTLKIDDREVMKVSGSGELESAISEIFSDEMQDQLCKLDLSEDDITISGFCSATQLTRADKRGLFTFLNGRVIQCYIMRSAIDAVYKKYLSPGKYPIVVLNLNIPTEKVDVNVHPTKKEVKYQNPNLIYRLVGDAVAKALSDSFYASNRSFQPSLEEHALQTQESPKQLFIATHTDIPETIFKPKFTTKDFDYRFTDLPSSPKPDVEKLSANNRRFISRFGSVDISIFDSMGLETNISSLGSKTNFEIVVKDVGFAKSILLRGDFIGENWLKGKYLSFISEMGREILEREILEHGFKPTGTSSTLSRPNASPTKKSLEEIWERDNYTCVYCAKALLHPDTVKEALKLSSNAALLNTHLASYDHYLPASKYPTLNEDIRNLFSICQSCNKTKSDSLATVTWKPEIKNSWKDYSESKPFEIAGLKFIDAKHFIAT